MNEMKKMALEMNTMADLWKTYEPQNEFEGAAVETMIGLLRASSLLFLMLQKETPDSQKSGAEGGNCK